MVPISMVALLESLYANAGFFKPDQEIKILIWT
jgi:hypothetical protein